MKTAVQKGLRAGGVFAVLIVFMGLIGFTVTGPALLAKLVGNAPGVGQMPAVPYLILFMALLGIWCGALAARPERHSGPVTLSVAAVSGAAAGALSGLVVTIYALIIGSVHTQGTDMRPYLAQVSPEAVRLFLFQIGMPGGALLHFVLLLASCIFGALMSFYLRSAGFAHKFMNGISAGIKKVTLQARRFPYAVYAIYAVLAILLFFMPRVWGSYWNYIVGTVGIYIILGLGLNIIVGMAGQLVLGYVAFFAIGAYTMALLTAPLPHSLVWNFWGVIVLAILASALTGLLLGLPILRLRGDYLAIVTLGFGEIIRIMLRSDLMTPITAGPKGVRDVIQPSFMGISLASDINFLYLILIFVLIFIFITRRLQNSRAGRAWVAIREDEVAARATGINTFQSKLLALAIGAAFAGLAGALFASRNQFTGPEDHSLMVSINVLALVIVGGLNSLPGIIMGSFALKGLPEILRELENYRLLVFGALLVMMMILRPEGLWPSSRPRLENHAQAEESTPQTVTSAAKVEGD
jgi:ABC-type branched-subunit amino acid transport system permease subunit